MPGIIVGVDGSPHSRRALQWALSEAAARHASLTVLSVHDEKAVTCTTGDLNQNQAAQDVQALVDQAVNSQSGPAPPVTVQVIPGSPAAELLDAGHHADLLVVGSRGSGGLGPRGVGSVSSQVAYDAPCPVVIIFPPLAAGQAGRHAGRPRFHDLGILRDDDLSFAPAGSMELVPVRGGIVPDGEGETYGPHGEIPGNVAQAGDDRRRLRRRRGRAGT
ncbi:universal stress protein [Trebonia sp.]